ncbi:Sapep family Mn(2+)-dependent dipeptidase [Enterococcus sp. AZ109]|uniref:Sapep family Mn(2+)-dependent dipeptidase n=1 Tax=Enterococcus sp. AZ109 TaxID=2774634 RepID=UPI003F24EA91
MIQTQETIELLTKLVSYKSYPTSDTNDQEAVLDFVLEYCGQLGFTVKKVSSILGWAQIGTQGPLAAFPVHLDVVPPGNGWDTDPFTLVKKDDVLFGRGVYDNKGPAAVMITLLKELIQQAEEKQIRLRIILGAQEETGMACIQQYTKLEENPVIGFVPDAMFPIVLGEKGRIHLLLEAQESVEWLENISCGEQVNSVPDYAAIKVKREQNVTNFDLSAVNGWEGTTVFSRGIPAHGAKPELGVNAFFKLLKTLDSQYYSTKMNDLLQLAEANGTDLGLSCPDHKFGDTTVNVGVVNYKSDHWKVEVDIRFGSQLSQETILLTIQQAFPGWNVTTLNAKKVHLVENKQLADQLLRLYSRKFPTEQLEPIYMGGSTYASYFPDFPAFGPRFPDTRTYAHGKNEQMKISDLEQLLQIYQEAIQIVIDEAIKNEH